MTGWLKSALYGNSQPISEALSLPWKHHQCRQNLCWQNLKKNIKSKLYHMAAKVKKIFSLSYIVLQIQRQEGNNVDLVRWLFMSHLIWIYTVCKFIHFHILDSKRQEKLVLFQGDNSDLGLPSLGAFLKGKDLVGRICSGRMGTKFLSPLLRAEVGHRDNILGSLVNDKTPGPSSSKQR